LCRAERDQGALGMGESLWGASPLRGRSEATVSQRQLHVTRDGDESTASVFAVRPCGMEAGGQPWNRTRVNPRTGWSGWASVPSNTKPDIRSCRDSSGGGVHGKRLTLTPGDLRGSAGDSGSVGGGNDAPATPVQKSDHPVVAMKPGNAGGAKGVTG
jgi:hypothetical protein